MNYIIIIVLLVVFIIHMDVIVILKNIINIQKHIKNKNMNFCKFIDNNNKTSFKNSYFGKLLNNKDIDTKIVKNDYKLNNNLF